MTTLNQELTGRYVSAGADRPSLDDQRGAGLGSLAELVDAAEEHLEHISHDVSQRSVVTPPTSRGDTA